MTFEFNSIFIIHPNWFHPFFIATQFFIVQTEATPHLDGMHSVFGQVFEGMDIVNEIANVQKDRMDKPLEDIVMEKVTLEKYSK